MVVWFFIVIYMSKLVKGFRNFFFFFIVKFLELLFLFLIVKIKIGRFFGYLGSMLVSCCIFWGKVMICFLYVFWLFFGLVYICIIENVFVISIFLNWVNFCSFLGIEDGIIEFFDDDFFGMFLFCIYFE